MDNTNHDGSLTRAVAQRQSTPAWMMPRFEIDCALQTLSAQLGRGPTESEIAAELHMGLTEYRQASRYLEDHELDTSYTEKRGEKEAGGSEIPSLPNQPRNGPFFPRRFAPEEEVAEALPDGTTSTRNSLDWIITAPEIEQAIRKLFAKCGRAPTEVEIAGELRIDLELYRETLNHLKDLEIGMLYAEQDTSLGGEWLTYAPNGMEGDARFRCLRSEMQGLFRNAVSNLPRMEQLIITLSYSEYLYDKSISVVLELPESTISNIRTSAVLHLRASLPDPHLQLRPRVRGALSDPNEGGTDHEHNEYGKMLNLDNADIQIYGSQEGLLPTGQPWEFLDDEADWKRDFRSWYSLDDEQRLTQIRRQEHYHLKLEL